jgi:hypothetical protein
MILYLDEDYLINMSSHSVSSGLKCTLLETTFSAVDEWQNSYDVVIQFHSAEVI